MKKWRRSLSKLSKFIWFQLKLRRFFTAWWIKGGQIKLLLVIVGTKHFPENVQFFFLVHNLLRTLKIFEDQRCVVSNKKVLCWPIGLLLQRMVYYRIVVTFSLGIPQWEGSPFHTISLCFFWHHLPWHISYTHSWRARCALAAGRRWHWPNFGQPFSLCLAESCFNGMALRLFPETEVQVPKYVTCSFSMIHISPLPIIFSSGYLLFSFSPNETATSWHSRRGWKIRKTWRSRKWRKNTSTNGGLVLRRVAEKTNLEVKNTENVHLKTLKAM